MASSSFPPAPLTPSTAHSGSSFTGTPTIQQSSPASPMNLVMQPSPCDSLLEPLVLCALCPLKDTSLSAVQLEEVAHLCGYANIATTPASQLLSLASDENARSNPPASVFQIVLAQQRLRIKKLQQSSSLPTPVSGHSKLSTFNSQQYSSVGDAKKAYHFQLEMAHSLVRSTVCSTTLSPGSLIIRVYEAKDLPAKKLNGSPDSYCKVVVGSAGPKLKTKVWKKSVDPQWNEEFQSPISSAMDNVRVEVWQHTSFRNSMISGTVVAINDLCDGETHTRWLPLHDEQGVQKGSVHVSLTVDLSKDFAVADSIVDEQSNLALSHESCISMIRQALNNAVFFNSSKGGMPVGKVSEPQLAMLTAFAERHGLSYLTLCIIIIDFITNLIDNSDLTIGMGEIAAAIELFGNVDETNSSPASEADSNLLGLSRRRLSLYIVKQMQDPHIASLHLEAFQVVSWFARCERPFEFATKPTNSSSNPSHANGLSSSFINQGDMLPARVATVRALVFNSGIAVPTEACRSAADDAANVAPLAARNGILDSLVLEAATHPSSQTRCTVPAMTSSFAKALGPTYTAMVSIPLFLHLMQDSERTVRAAVASDIGPALLQLSSADSSLPGAAPPSRLTTFPQSVLANRSVCFANAMGVVETCLDDESGLVREALAASVAVLCTSHEGMKDVGVQIWKKLATDSNEFVAASALEITPSIFSPKMGTLGIIDVECVNLWVALVKMFAETSDALSAGDAPFIRNSQVLPQVLCTAVQCAGPGVTLGAMSAILPLMTMDSRITVRMSTAAALPEVAEALLASQGLGSPSRGEPVPEWETGHPILEAAKCLVADSSYAVASSSLVSIPRISPLMPLEMRRSVTHALLDILSRWSSSEVAGEKACECCRVLPAIARLAGEGSFSGAVGSMAAALAASPDIEVRASFAASCPGLAAELSEKDRPELVTLFMRLQRDEAVEVRTSALRNLCNMAQVAKDWDMLPEDMWRDLPWSTVRLRMTRAALLETFCQSAPEEFFGKRVFDRCLQMLEDAAVCVRKAASKAMVAYIFRLSQSSEKRNAIDQVVEKLCATDKSYTLRQSCIPLLVALQPVIPADLWNSSCLPALQRLRRDPVLNVREVCMRLSPKLQETASSSEGGLTNGVSSLRVTAPSTLQPQNSTASTPGTHGSRSPPTGSFSPTHSSVPRSPLNSADADLAL